MSNFKIGDRVAVYALELELVGARGTVTDIGGQKVAVKLDRPTVIAEVPVLAPQQCRKLAPVKRRRIWLNPSWVDGKPVDAQCIAVRKAEFAPETFLEFVEVRRMK